MLGTVLDRCPSLTRIEAEHLSIQSDEHKDREWGVRELVVGWGGVDGMLKLARLPRLAAAGAAERPRVRISRASSYVGNAATQTLTIEDSEVSACFAHSHVPCMATLRDPFFT